MPLFEYSCRHCGQQFEILTLSARRDESVQCPHCGSFDVVKMLSVTRVRVASSSPTSTAPSAGCAAGSGFS